MTRTPLFLQSMIAASLALASVSAQAADKPVTAQEIAIGSKQYGPAQQSQGGLYTLDPELQAYVTRVGTKLTRVSVFPDLPYSFVVLNNSELNAWALPGGKIAVNRGLLAELDNEAQLAAVLAHEISHVTKRHSARMQKKAGGAGLLGALVGLGVGAKVPEYRELAMRGANAVAFAGQANYSRDHEIQADNEGIKLMAAAGYDPRAAADVQRVFLSKAQNRKSNALEALFASHPPSQERVDNNAGRAAKYPEGGMIGAAEYARATARLQKDKPAYALLAQAMTAYGEKKFDTSIAFCDKAIALQPKETLFWELKGITLLQQKQYTKSISALNQAVTLNSGFYRPLLYRGLAYKEQGTLDKAQSSLSASNALLPTQLATYHLGEIAQSQGDRETAIKHFTAVANAGGELGEAAKRQLRTL